MKDPEYAHVKKKPEREVTQRPPVRICRFKEKFCIDFGRLHRREYNKYQNYRYVN